jgi:hypothetical protein
VVTLQLPNRREVIGQRYRRPAKTRESSRPVPFKFAGTRISASQRYNRHFNRAKMLLRFPQRGSVPNLENPAASKRQGLFMPAGRQAFSSSCLALSHEFGGDTTGRWLGSHEPSRHRSK